MKKIKIIALSLLLNPFFCFGSDQIEDMRETTIDPNQIKAMKAIRFTQEVERQIRLYKGVEVFLSNYCYSDFPSLDFTFITNTGLQVDNKTDRRVILESQKRLKIIMGESIKREIDYLEYVLRTFND